MTNKQMEETAFYRLIRASLKNEGWPRQGRAKSNAKAPRMTMLKPSEIPVVKVEARRVRG